MICDVTFGVWLIVVRCGMCQLACCTGLKDQVSFFIAFKFGCSTFLAVRMTEIDKSIFFWCKGLIIVSVLYDD